jgi:hypothetical protein
MFLKGLIMLIKDLKIGYSKIDFKDHALFKEVLTVFEEIAFSAKVAQCLNSSTFFGYFVITMVFNSGFNPFMATASNMSSDIFLFVAS